MQPYPKSINQNNVVQAVAEISRYREEDITDRKNFPAIFLLARKVGKIPTSSADVADGDKVNDMNWDTDYLYILVDDGMGGAWRRFAGATW